MKKNKVFTIAVVVILTIGMMSMTAAQSDDNIIVFVDGVYVNFVGQQPSIVDGRTLVPVRGVFERLGFEVEWYERLSSVAMRSSDGLINLKIRMDEPYFLVQRLTIPIDVGIGHDPTYDFPLEVPAQIIGGSTMVPIRALLESIYYTVTWDESTRAVHISSPLPIEEIPTTVISTTEIPEEVSQAITNFSQTLFRKVLSDSAQNPVISPLSAYYALSMVAQGAQNHTLDEFSYLLNHNTANLPLELFNLANRFMNTDGSTILNIAGSVWVADRYDVYPNFDRIMTNYFGAPARSRDLPNPATIVEINRWVHDNTEGLIDRIVDSLSPCTAMVLLNALYFKGTWQYEMFDHRGVFYLASGEAVNANFISTSRNFTATENALYIAVTARYEAALLPYDCGRLGFLIVRPTDSTIVRDFADTYDLADIWSNLWRGHNAVIIMPEFELEFEITMNNVLQNMGLATAFAPGADFSGLVTESPLPGFEIDQVLQKVRIIVDKYGTEAAAVSGAILSTISSPPPPLIFNTPYIFAIYDLESGIPLFMGVMDDPR